MSKIDKMSLRELLGEISINIDERNMYIILGRDTAIFNQWRAVLLSRIRERDELKQKISSLSTSDLGLGSEAFLKNVAGMVSNSNSIEFAVEDFLPFESYIDKRALALLTLYNLQRKLEQDKEKGKEADKKVSGNIKRVMRIIGNEDFDVIEPVFEGKYIKRVKVYNSQEIINIVRKAKKLTELENPDKEGQARVLSIDGNVALDNIIQVLDERELAEGVFKKSTIGEAIAAQVLYNGVNRYQEAHPEVEVYRELEREEEDKNRDNATGEIATEEKETLGRLIFKSKEYKQSMKEAIIENYRYLDFDMLLLISAFKYLEMLDYGYERQGVVEISGENNPDMNLSDKVMAIEEILVRISVEIQKNPEFAIKYEDGTIIDYSKETLKRDLKRFKNGRYVKRAETKTAKDSLLSNEKTFLEIDEMVLRTMDITDEEFEVIIRNSEDNVIYLINENVIGKEDIMQVIYARGSCSEALFLTAYQKGLLSDEDIIKLFDDKKINGETIAKMEDGEIKQKISSYATEALRNSYLKVDEKRDATPEDLERFVRCVVLYKKLNIDGRTEEEIASNAFELISSFEDNISSKVLLELYQFGIISLEAAADWGVDLTDMLASKSIKPVDLRRLYAKKIISKDEIKNVLMNGELSYEEKLDLIYSTFDGESEEEKAAREELTELLEIGIGESYRSDEESTVRRKRQGEGVKGKEFISEPHTRWKLISLLDKDYSKGCLPDGIKVVDGHRVFLLPNHNKVVIERMHEKKKGKRVSAYGSATYVMGIEEFYKNIDNIIIDGAINRTFLRKAAESEQATKIIHSKHWGKSIKREFGIEDENTKYTPEEIDEINKAIANVENSRTER